MKRLTFRRVASFAVLPVISLVGTVAALPVIARVATVDEWLALAVGQGVGGVLALVVAYGWPIGGPSEIARCSVDDRLAMLDEAMVSRAIVALLGLAPCLLLCSLLVSDEEVWLAALMCAAAMSSGLSVSFYAIGTGRAAVLAIVETVPRALAGAFSALLVFATEVVALYPVALVTGQLVPLVVFWLGERERRPLPGWAAINLRFRKNLGGVAVETIAGAYSVGASAIVAAVAPPLVVGQFNSGERLTRWGSTGIVALNGAIQGWVAESRGPDFVARVRISFLLHGFLGLAGFAVLTGAGPWLSAVVFGERFAANWATCTALGVFFALWSIETVTGRHVLACAGKVHVLLLTTCVGSVVGVLGILWAAPHGPAAAATALASALGLIVVLQLPAAMRILARESQGAVVSPEFRS